MDARLIAIRLENIKLDLDAKLVDAARRAGKHHTRKEAVAAALNEYIGHRKRLKVLELFGTVEFDPRYNHKIDRRSKRRT